MRRTHIFALIAFLCLLAVAFADVAPESPKVHQQAAPVVDNSAQLKAVESKLDKLTSDLNTLRTNMNKVQDENKSLLEKLNKVQSAQTAQASAKPAVDTVTQTKVSTLHTTVEDLRAQLKELTDKVANLTFTAQVSEHVKTVKNFYTTTIQPKAQQAFAVASVYTDKAMIAARPMLGKSQMLSARAYHFVRALVNDIKPKIVTTVTPLIAQAQFIKPEQRPLVVDLIVVSAFFFIGFTVFIVAYLIISTILRLICCCGKKKAKKQVNQKQ